MTHPTRTLYLYLIACAAPPARRITTPIRAAQAAGRPGPASVPRPARPRAAAGLALQRAQIPLQQRLAEFQRDTGMTRAQLAEAVRDWGLSD
ncbi:hypothetical protein ACH4TS_21940 [Streptomyces albidoflavus]